MITGDRSSFVSREIVVKYYYGGEKWKLIFDMDAADPVQSVYFSEKEMRAAREAIGGRDGRPAVAGEEWAWEEQGVRNVRDEDEDWEERLEEEEEEEDVVPGGEEVVAEPQALTAETEITDPGVRTDVTPCWHHRSCMWSCMT